MRFLNPMQNYAYFLNPPNFYALFFQKIVFFLKIPIFGV